MLYVYREIKIEYKILTIQKACLRCGTMFMPRKTRHFYCSRKCFKKVWYQKQKQTSKVPEIDSSRPEYICSFCGRKSLLDFSPKTETGYKMLEHYKCPHCNKERGEPTNDNVD